VLALLAKATATTTATPRSPASRRASAFLQILKGFVILREAEDLLLPFFLSFPDGIRFMPPS